MILQPSFLHHGITFTGKMASLYWSMTLILYKNYPGITELYHCHHVSQVKNWVKELRKMLGNDISLCIAGNKIDLEKERHVPVEEAEA